MKHYDATRPIGSPENRRTPEILSQESYRKALKEILLTPAGITVFKEILERGMLFTSTFTGNSQTFFNEGMRNLALSIFSDIAESAPNAVPKLIMKGETYVKEI